jgi:hypothetical protein
MEINGKLVKGFHPTQRKMDVSTLPSGNYVLRIATQKGSFSRKMIKN